MNNLVWLLLDIIFRREFVNKRLNEQVIRLCEVERRPHRNYKSTRLHPISLNIHFNSSI
jgi:hypothetical protein